jgi:hypothetical protein
MPSQKLASGENLLKGELAAAWNILEGSSGDYTDLGIARRFGGAAAAYSLRDIGAMNGKVVRVRREPHDTSAGIDDEINFSANQVQSGALEDWVNGKLESTLPADVATAAAAYSLRKVKASYSGDAVRIRRSSDDIEVDVAFDSDDKVSASSAITNIAEQGGESGSTTATDLSGFLSETKDVPKSYDHSANPTTSQTVYVNVGKYGASQPSTYDGDSNPDSLPNIPNGSRYATKWTSTNAAYGFSYGKAYNDDTYTVEFDILQKTGTQNVKFQNTNAMEAYPQNNLIEGSLSSGSFTTKDQWVHYKMSFRTGATRNGAGLIRSGNTSVQTTWYIANFKITPTTDSDAFVHTWYDQAGSNNAVQETDVNQPKIAENGVLLDGIKFNANTDGTSPDFLQVATRLGVTTDHFVSAVFNGYQTDSSAFGGILNTRNGNAGFQYGIASSDNVQAFFYAGSGNNANSSSNFNLSNNSPKRLVTFDKDGDTLTGFGNSATNGLSISNAMNTPSTTVTNIGVGGNVGTTTSLGLRANINELIVYESDQAANRFKIESNINNYYSLYNDVNELAGNFTVDSSGSGTNASISNESKTGFTATVVDKAGFFGADLNEAIPNGSNLYISFIANLSPSGGTAATPNFGLADSSDKTGNSTGNPLDTAVTEGFNSITVAGTSSTCDRIRFTEGNDNVSFVISDLKVSRIARNGFVETLYDQSGNGDNMTQATAGSQPAIVQNGGQVKLICGKPAFKGDGTDDFLEASYFYSAGEVTSLSGFTVCSNDSDTGQEEAIISAGYGLSTTYPGFTIQLDRNSNADPFEIRTANASGANETPLLSIAKDGDILGSAFFTKDDTQLVRATTKDGSSNNSEATSVGALHSNSTSGKLRIGAIRSFAVRQFFGFFISEAIVFKGSDLRDEGIENEINQFYNIG